MYLLSKWLLIFIFNFQSQTAKQTTIEKIKMRTYFKMLLFVRTHQDKSPRCSTTRLFITSIHHQINEIKIFPFASIQRTFFKHKIVQKPIPKLQTQFSIWYLEICVHLHYVLGKKKKTFSKESIKSQTVFNVQTK